DNCGKCVTAEDTLVLVGDHSWGRNLWECEKDLQYIMDLPGRKILIRGNHDMFWDARKTESLNKQFKGKLEFLQGNFCVYQDHALVGTKGHAFEGPFYLDRSGNVTGWDEAEAEHSAKLVKREAERLEVSFQAAKKAGYSRFIMFLHYPPTNVLQKNSIFTKMAESYGVEQVVYAHCHGESRFHDSILGKKRGIRYSLVSGDYLRWHPMKVLD
ncbi:MAG: metallophosphoesterase, partial [Parasporobacterium sp.]|nr:metallophosphoesterase [Parasporobacterium sp.]